MTRDFEREGRAKKVARIVARIDLAVMLHEDGHHPIVDAEFILGRVLRWTDKDWRAAANCQPRHKSPSDETREAVIVILQARVEAFKAHQLRQNLEVNARRLAHTQREAEATC